MIKLLMSRTLTKVWILIQFVQQTHVNLQIPSIGSVNLNVNFAPFAANLNNS